MSSAGFSVIFLVTVVGMEVFLLLAELQPEKLNKITDVRKAIAKRCVAGGIVGFVCIVFSSSFDFSVCYYERKGKHYVKGIWG